MSQKSISSMTVFLLALATGLAVAGIYLLQPLLHSLAISFGVSTEAIGLVMTLTQIGYALGILFLVPLGDIFPKKKLIVRKMVLLSLALVATGFANGVTAMMFASFAVGIFATTAQDIVPFAAGLAPVERRGQVVGQVMSGLLLGILLSRTLSGAIAGAWGWRATFWISGATVLVVCGLLTTLVSAEQQGASDESNRLTYRQLLASTLGNFAKYKVLRSSVLTQALIGMAFTAFWTNLSFFLSAAPFSMSTGHIGLFGLAGAMGALVAPVAGKLSDKRGARAGIFIGVSLVAVSFATMFLFPMSLAVLIAGTVVFDLGIQMALISHQSAIYSLEPAQRSRLNALFVACLFGAFSLGSFVSVRIESHWGWRGVLVFGVCVSTVALVLASLNFKASNTEVSHEIS